MKKSDKIQKVEKLEDENQETAKKESRKESGHGK